MRKKLYFLVLLIIFLFTSIFAKEIKKENLWRYDLEKAIFYVLKDENLFEIQDLAINLKGSSLQESIWNILMWEEKNIKYDFEKANLPEPIIYIWTTGEIEVIQGENNIFQTPYETIQLGKGICKDYALLTTGLLLKMNYFPIYILEIEFQNDPIKHTTVGMVVDGWLFILDQNPPPMDPGTYYKYWFYNEGKIITNINLYEINKKEGFSVLKDNLKVEDFKSLDYEPTSKDLEYIGLSLMKIFKDNFSNLNVDNRVYSLDKLQYLPKGYSKGKIWYFEFPDFLEFYNPVFHFQFVNKLYRDILEDGEVYKDMKTFTSFFIRVEKINKGIRLILNLAL